MPSWYQAIPAFLIAAAVLFAPGLAVLSIAGVRGLRLWAMTVPTTFTIASLTAVIFGILHIRYSAWSFAASAAVIAATAAAMRALYLRRQRGVPRDRASTPATSTVRIATLIGLGLAALLIGGRLLAGIGSPDAIAQLFDNVFHLNAVAIVHETGAGSSVTLGNLTEASRGFYPAAFHGVTALLLDFGVPTAVALNVVSIIMAAVTWPLSVLYFTTRVFGRRTDAIVFASILAAAFAAFPYRPLSFGVLYPFHAGMTMTLVITALIVELFAMQRTERLTARTAVALLLAVTPGIALTHPSVVVAALLLALPFMVASVLRDCKNRGWRTRRARILWAAAGAVGTAVAFVVLRPSLTTAPWDPYQTYKEAIGAIITVSPGGITAVAWGLFALALIGLAESARSVRSWWPVAAMYAIGGALYFSAAAVGSTFVRDLLAGVWYRDTERLSAVFVVAALPIVLLGALTLTRAARAVSLKVVPYRRVAWVSPATIAVIAIALVLVTQRGPLPQAQVWLNQSFGNAGEQRLLSDDERELMRDVAEMVPVNGVVVGNPRTGASLTPAFAGRATIAPHIYGARSGDEQYLLDHWDEAATDPAVCPIIRSLNAFWALDFGSADVWGGTQPELKGTDSLSDGAEGIDALATVGGKGLYIATVCRPPSS